MTKILILERSLKLLKNIRSKIYVYHKDPTIISSANMKKALNIIDETNPEIIFLHPEHLEHIIKHLRVRIKSNSTKIYLILLINSKTKTGDSINDINDINDITENVDDFICYSDINSLNKGLDFACYRYKNYRDSDSLTRSFISTKKDIGDLLNMKNELKKAHKNFEIIMDGLDALVYVSDFNTHELLFLNRYGQEIWGKPEGKPCWNLFQSGQTGPCDFCTNNKLRKQDGTPADVYVWEYQNTANDRWYECQDQAIYWPDGRVVRLEIAIDITGRKQCEKALRESEEKLKMKLIESENLLVLSEGLKYSDNIEDVCKKSLESICAAFNFTKGAIFLVDENKNNVNLMHEIGYKNNRQTNNLSSFKPNDLIRFIVTDNKWFIIQNGKLISNRHDLIFSKSIQKQLRFSIKKGDYILAPIKSQKRNIGFILLDFSNLQSFSLEINEMLDLYLTTIGIALENVSLYKEMEQSYQNLKEIDKLRTEFIDVASHELRTPLAAVKLYIELMMKGIIGNFSKKEFEQLEDINTNLIYLDNLIQDMLDFSRTGKDYLKLSLKKVNFVKVAQESIKNLQPLAKGRNIQLKLVSDCESTITSDSQMLKRIFTNLISNAIKYSHNGDNVIITLHEDSDKIFTSVKDTGIGISKKDLPHIFERFYMGDTSLTREKDQLGLGLSIVKSFVTRLGGNVWADSELGKGSVFNFTIPKQQI